MEVKTFEYRSKNLRCVLASKGLMFVAADVCEILSLSINTSIVCSKLLSDEKETHQLFVAGQRRKMICLNLLGLIRIVLNSTTTDRDNFISWVFRFVLPRAGGSSADVGNVENLSPIAGATGHHPGDLPDISFTLDLTHVVTNPSEESLNVLEKLTGINF